MNKANLNPPSDAISFLKCDCLCNGKSVRNLVSKARIDDIYAFITKANPSFQIEGMMMTYHIALVYLSMFCGCIVFDIS